LSLLVNEIFYSIQGESTFVGRPCAFVRLTGCNLRCAWCDTAYAWDEGREMTRQAILAQVSSHACPLVEITGGEPLTQAETPELIRDFLDKGATVLVETNGSLPVWELDQRCIAMMDVKCPGSGMAGRMEWANLDRLRPQDELKFVLTSQDDYEYAREVVLDLKKPVAQAHFIPAFGVLNPRRLAEWILADRLAVRLSLQLHKIIWPPQARGV
jgi:7-carboxy-7-deazaguanine synthase